MSGTTAPEWRETANARLLLTGGSGFIGFHCLAPLVRRRFEVHAVCSTGVAPHVDGVSWHRADLLEPGEGRRIVERVRPHALLHLAWYVQPGSLIGHEDNLRWVIASAELLRAFRDQGGRRCVAAGTCYEYDWQQDLCHEELTPSAPATLYGAAKNALRQLWLAYCLQAGISAAWGRVFFLYGPREHPRRLVSSIAISLLSGKEAPSSAGEQVRDYLHVQDVADALVALVDSSCVGTVNICSGMPTRVRDIVEQLGELSGCSELLRIGAIPTRATDAPFVVGDGSRLKQSIGWTPRIGLTEGLAATLEWWSHHLPGAR